MEPVGFVRQVLADLTLMRNRRIRMTLVRVVPAPRLRLHTLIFDNLVQSRKATSLFFFLEEEPRRH